MVERVNSADVALLHLDTQTAPQHVGTVMLLSGGFDYDRLARLVAERVAPLPRYRRRLRAVPGRLAAPVWSDDSGFDLTYHVRRTALTGAIGDAALLDFCARIMARPLERRRPLWEIYLVEGLPNGQVALITKTHRTLLDGPAAADVAAALVDPPAGCRDTVAGVWTPTRESSAARLFADAVWDAVRKPAVVTDAVRSVGSGALSVSRRAIRSALAASASLAGLARRGPEADFPRGEHGGERRIAVARTRLEDFRDLSGRHGGAVSDAVLAVVSAALHDWRGRYRVSIANTLGAESPRFVDGARVTEVFPLPPISEGHMLAIGVTSYDGGVYFGINGDRTAVPDVAVIGTAIEDCLAWSVATGQPAARLAGAR